MSQATRRFRKAKLVQSKIQSTKDWIENVGKLLTVPIAKKFVENKIVEDNSLLFIGYGNRKEVVSDTVQLVN